MKTIHYLIVLGVITLLATQSMAQAPEYGYAIYYADYFQGKRTANGEIYDKYALTCAHKVHPFGTLLKVTRTDNFKSVVVRVNDRGPYNPGCVIDLSWAAADQIGLLLDGKAEVKVEVVNSGTSNAARQQESFAQLTVKSAPQSYNAPSAIQEQAVPQSYNSYSASSPVAESNNSQNIRVPIQIPAKGTAKTSQPATAAVPSDVPVAYSAFPEQMTASATPRGVTATAEVQKGYSIQVGSYSYQANADRQAKMIRDKGVQNVTVKRTDGPSGSFYKILVGSFNNKTEANNFLPKLKNQYGLAGYVVNLANM